MRLDGKLRLKRMSRDDVLDYPSNEACMSKLTMFLLLWHVSIHVQDEKWYLNIHYESNGNSTSIARCLSITYYYDRLRLIMYTGIIYKLDDQYEDIHDTKMRWFCTSDFFHSRNSWLRWPLQCHLYHLCSVFVPASLGVTRQVLEKKTQSINFNQHFIPESFLKSDQNGHWELLFPLGKTQAFNI